MNGVAFTFCLLAGLDQIEVEELVLRCCVERTVPRRAWRKDVKAEIRRQRAPNPDLSLEDYLCGVYYQTEVDEYLRGNLLYKHWYDSEYDWSFQQRLWLATRGRHGDRPFPGQLVNLNCKVLRIGQELPAAVRRGVPAKRWVEKIGRPK
jgi:hypothetical protein